MMNKLTLITLTLLTTMVLQAQSQVDEQVLPGGGTDVAMTKDHMAVVVTGGVDFYDMNYATFKWDKIQSSGLPDAVSVDIDGEFAIVGAPTSVTDVEYLYGIRGNDTTTFLRYDIAADTWDEMAHLPENAKYGASLTAVGNKIYAIAGSGSGAFYVYDIPTNTWDTVKKTDGSNVNYFTTISSNSGGSSIAYDGGHFIYGTKGLIPAFFGFSNDFSNDFERFDLGNPDGGWVAMQNIPKTHSGFLGSWGGCAFGCSLASDGTDMYMTEGSSSGFFSVFGGNDSKKVLKYSPSGNSWTDGPEVGVSVGSGGTMTYDDGKLYLIVGKTGQFFASHGSKENFVFDFANAGAGWTALTLLPEEAAAGAALVFGGSDLYAMRGTDTATFMQYDFTLNGGVGAWVVQTNINTGSGPVAIGP
ncbi:MAG TPA: hypothetical protein EYP23_04630, partial [Thermoplasmata archaeon]|nr:hypothetical protein [Thermoplasmata archaeon]